MNENVQFNEVVKEWLNTNKYLCKESTYFKYQQLFENHICPYFESIDLNEIDTQTIIDFLIHCIENGRKDGKGGLSGSVHTIKYILQSSITYGANIGYMEPINFRFKVPNYKNECIETLTEEEQKSLENYIYQHFNLSTLGILLCLYTGLRIGEICALQWEDISLKESSIMVRKTVQRLPIKKVNAKTTLKINPPKSKTSYRKVPIPHFICKHLEKYKQEDLKTFLLTGNTHPLDPRTYQYRFNKYLKESNIRHVNFHALRHTFATRCIQTGIDVKTVSEILGHSNINITMNFYVYSSFDFKKEQIEKLCKYH